MVKCTWCGLYCYQPAHNILVRFRRIFDPHLLCAGVVAELVSNFRWSRPFEHIESDNSGVRWLNCAYCCVRGVQIALQTALVRLSVFRLRNYGGRPCPLFVLLVYLRYGACLWFWVSYFRNGKRKLPAFFGLNRSVMSMWYQNTSFCRVRWEAVHSGWFL